MSTPLAQFEVYGFPSSLCFEQAKSILGSEEPCVFNGNVSVERYRVTIEKIEEPQEVLRERLLTLLSQPGGHVSKREYIRAKAKRLGIEL